MSPSFLPWIFQKTSSCSSPRGLRQRGCVGTGPAYPNFSPVYFCPSPGQLVPVGVNLIASFLPPSLWSRVRLLVVQGNYTGGSIACRKPCPERTQRCSAPRAPSRGPFGAVPSIHGSRSHISGSVWSCPDIGAFASGVNRREIRRGPNPAGLTQAGPGRGMTEDSDAATGGYYSPSHHAYAQTPGARGQPAPFPHPGLSQGHGNVFLSGACLLPLRLGLGGNVSVQNSAGAAGFPSSEHQNRHAGGNGCRRAVLRAL